MRAKWLVLLSTLLIAEIAFAQDGIPIIKIVKGGEFGLVKQDPFSSLSEGDRLNAIRRAGSETVEVGEVTVVRCQADACAIKLTRAKGNGMLMVGDELITEASFGSGTSEASDIFGDLGSSGTSGASDWKLSLGLSGRASSLGFGGELGVGLHPKLGFRIGYHAFTYSYKGENTEEEYEYLADAKLKSMCYFLDWYPTAGSYHVTLGLVNNLNVFDLTVTPTGTYTYGDQVYQPDEIGILTGKIDFDKNVPYIGFGWGSPAKGSFGLVLDIGVFYQKSPHVSLTATEMLEPTAEQDEEIAESLEGWKAYGVVSLGLKFRIF